MPGLRSLLLKSLFLLFALTGAVAAQTIRPSPCA